MNCPIPTVHIIPCPKFVTPVTIKKFMIFSSQIDIIMSCPWCTQPCIKNDQVENVHEVRRIEEKSAINCPIPIVHIILCLKFLTPHVDRKPFSFSNSQYYYLPNTSNDCSSQCAMADCKEYSCLHGPTEHGTPQKGAKRMEIQDPQHLKEDDRTVHEINLLLEKGEIIYPAPVGSRGTHMLDHPELHIGPKE